MNEINCKECGHSINEHSARCRHHDVINPATWEECECRASARDIAAARDVDTRQEALQDAIAAIRNERAIATLFEDFHTEIMTQTLRGCEGADFTLAKEIYLEFLHTQPAAPAEQEEGQNAIY